VDYEEVARPDPNPPPERRSGPPEYLDVMFVAAYPIEHEDDHQTPSTA
jgi:hypothetical protein